MSKRDKQLGELIDTESLKTAEQAAEMMVQLKIGESIEITLASGTDPSTLQYIPRGEEPNRTRNDFMRATVNSKPVKDAASRRGFNFNVETISTSPYDNDALVVRITRRS